MNQNTIHPITFRVKRKVLWVVMPCNSKKARSFRGIYRIHLQCRRVCLPRNHDVWRLLITGLSLLILWLWRWRRFLTPKRLVFFWTAWVATKTLYLKSNIFYCSHPIQNVTEIHSAVSKTKHWHRHNASCHTCNYCISCKEIINREYLTSLRTSVVLHVTNKRRTFLQTDVQQ